MTVRLRAVRSPISVGLGIGRDAVRVLALRHGRIAWAMERARGDEPLVRTIDQVLADAPLRRWPRPRVTAAVGPWHVQSKRLSGLPPMRDASRLEDVVRESASRFFLKNGVPLVTTVRARADEVPWGAAVEQPVLEAIEQACRLRRVRLSAIVPTVSVLRLAVESADGSITLWWRDGDLRTRIALEDDQLVSVQRDTSNRDEGADEPPRSPALDVLGPDGWRFADALAAARARPSEVIGWRTGGARARARAVSGWRLAIAASAVIVSGAALLAAPGAAARVAERTARERLTSLGPLRQDVALAERELEKVTGALAEVAAFDADRYSAILLLGDLTNALPNESALVTLRVARESGSLVALTPRAATVLVRLERVPGIESAEIVGPVTREIVAGKTLERVTIRFRVVPSARRSPGDA